LVKSAQQMVATAEDMKNAGVQLPGVGGGRGSVGKVHVHQNFSGLWGDVFYAKDAMAGLDLANRLMEKESREKLVDANRTRQSELRSRAGRFGASPKPAVPRAVIRARRRPAPCRRI
jgi:5-methyltetrahydrofolate--homocysteine methyltransferase